MNDRDLQAPWVGCSREEYYRKDQGEIVGYCEDCGKEIREHDTSYDVSDGCICEMCYDERIKQEED